MPEPWRVCWAQVIAIRELRNRVINLTVAPTDGDAVQMMRKGTANLESRDLNQPAKRVTAAAGKYITPLTADALTSVTA